MERWLRSNIYPGKRKQWEMIWMREAEKLSFSFSQFFHPHLLPSLDNSANLSSFHFLPARSLVISEPLRSCLFSPRTYLIWIHPLPDQTCHTTTNYLIRAVPLHCSIPFPPLLRHNLRQHLFNSLFSAPSTLLNTCRNLRFNDIFMPLWTNSALVSLFSVEALK